MPGAEMKAASSETFAEAGVERRPPASSRLLSLDVLRGLTVAVMILVNNGGDGAHSYRILEHARWNGCTLADVVFPCFLFMVGLSGVFSIGGRLNRGVSRGLIVWQAAKRSMIIFGLGLAINGFPFFSLDTLRIFGVLQRIALCYFAAVLFLLFTSRRTIVVSFFSILIGYWILLRWVPVPRAGVPGSAVPFLDPHANLPAWLDRQLLPARHLYRQGYYDPEGLLSSLSAIASTLLGALTGMWVSGKRERAVTARYLLVAGCLSLAVGLVWSHWFPLNKRLWTSSFVFWTGGISLLSLWVLFELVDVRQVSRRWFYPAVIFGTNALAAYVLSELLAGFLVLLRLPSGQSVQRWLFLCFAGMIPNLSLAALAYALAFVAVCLVVPWILYRKQIFLKV